MEGISLAAEERKAFIRKMRLERKSSRCLRMHIILLTADGHSPSQIACTLYCSRTTIYAAVRRYQ